MSEDIISFIAGSTQNFLVSWDTDLSNIFDTIEEVERVIVEKYSAHLSEFIKTLNTQLNDNTSKLSELEKSKLTEQDQTKLYNINTDIATSQSDITNITELKGTIETEKEKIITAFKLAIGIVGDVKEYRRRYSMIYNKYKSNNPAFTPDRFYSFTYTYTIDSDNTFYMNVIIHHTWGYVSTYVNGPDTYYNIVFANALCYGMCYNNNDDSTSFYLGRTFGEYRKNNSPQKLFKPTDTVDRRAYLEKFFETESQHYITTLKLGVHGDVNLHDKRMQHVKTLLDSYDDTIISGDYKYWKKILKQSVRHYDDFINFPPKTKYFFEQIYAIEYLYSLITFSTLGSAASSTKAALGSAASSAASRITGMFGSKPAQALTSVVPAPVAAAPAAPAAQVPAKTSSGFMGSMGSMFKGAKGGKKTRRIRRKSATMIRHRRGGHSLRRKKNTRQTRYTRARRT